MTSSFPSGHTATDLAFSLGVSQEVPVLFIPLTVATMAAHWSIVRSRGHYPSDVLAGGVIAFGVAWRHGGSGRPEARPTMVAGTTSSNGGAMSGGEPSGLQRAKGMAAREKEEYEAGSDRPVGSFLAIMGVYLVGVAGLGVVLRRRGHVLPERLSAADLALITVATHKLSRLLAKDPVTSPLRAPFTRFAGTSGPAELQEKVRGSGLRRAMGALVTCPFCLAVWVATGFGFSILVAPGRRVSPPPPSPPWRAPTCCTWPTEPSSGGARHDQSKDDTER